MKVEKLIFPARQRFDALLRIFSVYKKPISYLRERQVYAYTERSKKQAMFMHPMTY